MMLEEILAGAFVAGLALLAGKAIHDDPEGVKARFTNRVNNMWTCPDCGQTNTRYLCRCGNWKCQGCGEINSPRSIYCKNENCDRQKGDWECQGCGEINLSRSKYCEKCGLRKEEKPKEQEEQED